MSVEDPGAGRVKRMLPSVSEVLKELTARADIGPDVAFRAAREVCAEELKRIRDAGGDSAPIEELVQRALVRATGGRVPLASAVAPAPEPPAAPPDAVFEPAEPPPPADEPSVEDPFSETAAAMDLRWEKEGREPFSEAAAVPEPPAILLSEAESGAEVEPETGTEAVGEINGPGDETLSRLSREAESIDLNAVFPRPPVPFSTVAAGPRAAGTGEDAARDEVPPPFEDDEDTVLTIPRGGRTSSGEEKGSRVGVLVGVALGLVALAGLGYLLVGLWMERDAAPPPVAVVRPRRTAPAAPPAATPAPTPAALPATSPAASPAPGVTHPAAVAAPVPTPASVPLPSPTPERPAAPRVEPTRPTAVVASPRATPAAPAPTLVRSAPVRLSRDGIIYTRDRAGQPEAFSIHFTSYKDRASAERDVKRVEALAGLRAWVAEVDLGEKGTWYRVMAGAFATAREAKDVRDALAAKGTRDLGWVYRVVGTE